MKRVLVSRRAYDDLKRLEDWLDDRNPTAALRLGPMLDAAIGSLSEFPERGRPVGTGFREIQFPFGAAAYLIQYRVDEDSVIVARVLHSREER